MPLRLRSLPTDALTTDELRAIRALMDTAFGTGDEAFADEDWEHALGGLHVVLDLDGEVVSHASVVERALEIGGRPFRTGYVEAVATDPGRQDQGYGTRVMTAATEHVRATFELGARPAHVLRATRLADLAGPGLRPDLRRRAANTRRGGLHPRPSNTELAAVRPRREDQLRLADRGRLVATART